MGTLTPSPDKSQWMSALARIEFERIVGATELIRTRYAVQNTSLPVAGLAMMQIRESANGDAFNLGEIPYSIATISLRLDDGREIEGSGQVMADDAELATQLAICDVALRHDLPEGDEVRSLLEEGMNLLQRDRNIRQSMLNRTKVRFALLNEDANL